MIISISHTKGGVGKSTIAFNLAAGLKGAKVVDLDFQKTITYLSGLRYERKRFPVYSFDSLDKFSKFVEEVKDDEIVIVDVGGFDSDLNRAALIVADLVITPVSDSPTEILGLLKFEKIIKEIEVKAGIEIEANVILNQIDYRKRDFGEIGDFVKNKPNFKLMKTILRDRVIYKRSVGEGLSVMEYDRKSPASKEVRKLINEIKKGV